MISYEFELSDGSKYDIQNVSDHRETAVHQAALSILRKKQLENNEIESVVFRKFEDGQLLYTWNVLGVRP